MNSFSHFDQLHVPEASADRPRQAARQFIHQVIYQAIKFPGCWHSLFWTGLAALGTFTFVGLEGVFIPAANAHPVIAQLEGKAAIDQDGEMPSGELASTVQSDALETLSESANQPESQSESQSESRPESQSESQSESQPTHQLIDRSINQFADQFGDVPGDLQTIDPVAILPFSNAQTSSDNNNQDSEKAIDQSGELRFNVSPFNFNSSTLTASRLETPGNAFRRDNANPDESAIAAGTENANLIDRGSEIRSAAQSSAATPFDNPSAAAPVDETQIAQGGSALLGAPFVQLQGAVVVQGDEVSARARTTASYAISPNVLVGGTLDLVTGDAFTDSPESGLNLNELYIAVSPSEIPTLRFVAGLLDYTSYFDRNSFAKDGVTQFFNPIFQTNPALAAAGLSSRPGLLVNWSVTDNLELRAAGFSSRRDLGDFALDGFAAEAAVRVQNLILRGTYLTAVDAGDDSGFREIFQFDRGDGDFGLRSGDREQAYGINAEYFVPSIRLGLFARYGWYDNLDLGQGGETYSFGFNVLDLLMADDRLGLAYGRDLSDEGLRKRRGDDLPDVLELFYDARLLPNLRAGITAQARNSFSETILGFRVRADFTLSDLGRIFR